MIKKRKSQKIEFNTTALPDIVFMLLFFFMVVTVMKENEQIKNIEVPTVKESAHLKKHKNYINLGIDKTDDQVIYFVENELYSTTTEVEKRIESIISKGLIRHDLKVKIKVHPDTEMKQVNELKSILQKKEIYNIEYMTKRRT